MPRLLALPSPLRLRLVSFLASTSSVLFRGREARRKSLRPLASKLERRHRRGERQVGDEQDDDEDDDDLRTRRWANVLFDFHSFASETGSCSNSPTSLAAATSGATPAAIASLFFRRRDQKDRIEALRSHLVRKGARGSTGSGERIDETAQDELLGRRNEAEAVEAEAKAVEAAVATGFEAESRMSGIMSAVELSDGIFDANALDPGEAIDLESANDEMNGERVDKAVEILRGWIETHRRPPEEGGGGGGGAAAAAAATSVLPSTQNCVTTAGDLDAEFFVHLKETELLHALRLGFEDEDEARSVRSDFKMVTIAALGRLVTLMMTWQESSDEGRGRGNIGDSPLGEMEFCDGVEGGTGRGGNNCTGVVFKSVASKILIPHLIELESTPPRATIHLIGENIEMV